jgi:hypothetical protein
VQRGEQNTCVGLKALSFFGRFSSTNKTWSAMNSALTVSKLKYADIGITIRYNESWSLAIELNQLLFYNGLICQLRVPHASVCHSNAFPGLRKLLKLTADGSTYRNEVICRLH